MSCTNCSIGLKPSRKNGFEDVIVNFSTGETSCIIQKDQSEEKVKKIITKLGYTILSNQDDNISLKVEKYFYTALFFTIPLFLHMFVAQDSFLQDPLLQFILLFSSISNRLALFW